MGYDQSRADALETKLLGLTTQIAQQFDRPATDRDPVAIRALWAQVDGIRPTLNARYRQMRKDMAAIKNRRSDAYRALWRHSKALRARLHLWDKMAALVAQHIDAPADPICLMRPENDSDAMLTMMYKAVHQLANPNGQSKDAADKDYFPDIALRIELFDQLMLTAHRLLSARGRAEGARFLDVGCGGGSKVLAATRYFAQCDGLEYDQVYADAAVRFFQTLNAQTCHVITGDALTFDGYADYDVIYFYRPIADDALLHEMESRICAMARPGTIIVAPYESDSSLGPHDNWQCAHILGPIFVTGMSQQQADEWHHEATQTSPQLVKRAADLPFDPGFWRPLFDATRYDVKI